MNISYKKVILTGFAFFIITAFWSAYDNIIPLILHQKFNFDHTMSGVVVALDNILAVFMLPLFGSLSDKTKTRWGKRTPYIALGTILAIVSFIFIPIIDNIVVFIAVLLVALISMATFRSPAVALMPDVTCKPHRSKANAIINLMGTAGGMIVLGLGIVFNTSKVGKTDFFFYTLAVCFVMILGLIIFLITVKEKSWAKQMEEDTEKYFPDSEVIERESVGGKLSKSQLKSLVFLLSSVVFWFMGYNAVTSKYSLYATEVLKQDYNITMIVAQVSAIVTYVPVGILASKIGRKKSILIGVFVLFISFFCASFIREGTSPVIMFSLFALAGIGWATINVNSFPMVVELAKGSDTGKYTGIYYTASMSSQVVTPILSGIIMTLVGNMTPLFIYSSVCVFLAIITMLFVKHGDSKPKPKIEEIFND